MRAGRNFDESLTKRILFFFSFEGTQSGSGEVAVVVVVGASAVAGDNSIL